MTDNIHFAIEGNYQYRAYHKGICFQRSWHALKYERALQLLAIKDSDTVLDAACGSAVLDDLMSKRSAATITAVDFSEPAIRFCQKQYAQSSISFLHKNLSERCFGENTFSKIVMLEVLEHLQPDLAVNILKNLNFYLKPGGIIVLSTPNKNSGWPAIEFVLDALKLTPKMKDEQHVKLYNTASLSHILQQSGFSNVVINTSHFAAPWLSFLGMKTAERIDAAEQRLTILPGSLLFATATKK